MQLLSVKIRIICVICALIYRKKNTDDTGLTDKAQILKPNKITY